MGSYATGPEIKKLAFCFVLMLQCDYYVNERLRDEDK
jgi:hypothetical protein